MKTTLKSLVFLVLILAPGCGQMSDPNNIRIAKIGNQHITRGELFQLINDMDDADRPKHRTRGDLLRTLNRYIDQKVTVPLGQQLAKEGKISVPREAAREQFFRDSGDDQEQYRSIWNMEPPADGEVTPLMKVYNLTPSGMKAMKMVIEQKTDRILERMLADTAVQFLAAQDFKAGTITLDDKDLEREYRIRKDTLKKFEWMRFLAIRYPAASEDALAQAAGLRKRMDAGESFEALVVEVQGLQTTAIARPGASATVIESEIENNPDLTKFRGFWSTASGAKPGDIIGPVYLPQYQQMTQDAQGRASVVNMPDAWLVMKIEETRPESEMTMEEAKLQLAPPILIAQEMKLLREKSGVEVYADKLPDLAQSGPFADDPAAGM